MRLGSAMTDPFWARPTTPWSERQGQPPRGLSVDPGAFTRGPVLSHWRTKGLMEDSVSRRRRAMSQDGQGPASPLSVRVAKRSNLGD
jgi:hypothetical protein